MRHATRLPGKQIADIYLDWMQHQAEAKGIVLVAERAGSFIGFAAGWIEQTENIGETAESNRFGYISDICIMAGFRGQKIAARLLDEIEPYFGRKGVVRLRINLAGVEHVRSSELRACWFRSLRNSL